MSVWVWVAIHIVLVVAVIVMLVFMVTSEKFNPWKFVGAFILLVVLLTGNVGSTYLNIIFDGDFDTVSYDGSKTSYDKPGYFSHCDINLDIREKISFSEYLKGITDYTVYADVSYKDLDDSVVVENLEIVKVEGFNGNDEYECIIVGDIMFPVDQYMKDKLVVGESYKVYYDRRTILNTVDGGKTLSGKTCYKNYAVQEMKSAN